QGKPALPVGCARVIHGSGIARILLEFHQTTRCFEGFVVALLIGVSGHKEMHIMPMMSARVERVCFDVSQFVCCRVLEGFCRFRPFARLRIDMARHVQCMRNVRNQLRITLTAWPGVFRESGAFETVNYVVVSSRMIWSFLYQLAKQRGGLHAALTRRLSRCFKSSHQMQCQIRLSFN